MRWIVALCLLCTSLLLRIINLRWKGKEIQKDFSHILVLSASENVICMFFILRLIFIQLHLNTICFKSIMSVFVCKFLSSIRMHISIKYIWCIFSGLIWFSKYYSCNICVWLSFSLSLSPFRLDRMCCFVYKSIFNKSNSFFFPFYTVLRILCTLYEHWPTTRAIYNVQYHLILL